MVYNILKLFHIVAVLVFFGNIFTGFYWMHIAKNSGNLKIISHTIKGVIKSDRLFTIPCYTIVTAFGLFTAIYGNIPLIRSGWILWPILLFIFSGVLFAIRVEPALKKLLKLTINQDETVNFDWNSFIIVYKQWRFWGLLGLLILIITLVMMVLKIPR